MEGGKKEILVTGGTGLVGSRIVELLSSSFNFIQISRVSGVDISYEETFQNIPEHNAKILIHLAAKADVDGCEAEKSQGKASEAWRINVEGTRNIASYCRKKDIQMLYVSTDFVFGGEKPEGEYYTEKDTPHPINFYAQTKYEAEKIVQEINPDNIILRISHPYRKEFEKKKDFIRRVAELLTGGQEVHAISDQILCPTFIDDIAKIIPLLLSKNQTGIFHAVGSSHLSPFDISLKVCELLHVDKNLVKKVSREEFFKGKANRPFNLYLKNDRIEKLNAQMSSIDEGLRQVII